VGVCGCKNEEGLLGGCDDRADGCLGRINLGTFGERTLHFKLCL
jgi:hypothetical protein